MNVHSHPLMIDSFCGGGGVSEGIKRALGIAPQIAINHNEVSLSMHEANHPDTLHLKENVHKVNIEMHTNGQKVDLLWGSPDCTKHSRASGKKKAHRNKSMRGLAWCLIRYVKDLKQNKPNKIVIENVPEFADWEEFPRFCNELKRNGYKIDTNVLRACDYGAPTIRQRFFLIARSDGKKITWPKPTHGKPGTADVLTGKLKPWIAVSECIDWSLPCPSIFDTSEEIKEKHGLRAIRPLADNTLKRIAKGLVKFVLEAKEPFFVTLGQHGGSNRSGSSPMSTICASSKDQNAIVVPKFVSTKHVGNVAAFIAQHNTGAIGRPANAPLSTLTSRATQQTIITANMINLKGTGDSARSCTEPANTICAKGTHVALVSAFLVKYYGQGIGQHLTDPIHTLTTKDRYGLVTVEFEGEQYAIADIGMRMLSNREQFRAQGFYDDYKINHGADGRVITKTQQTSNCGNSVPPPMVEAIIRELSL